MPERKTRADLEAENAALRALLTAIGEAHPPLPGADADMPAWYRECASRLSDAAIAAASAAAYQDEAVPLVLLDKTVRLHDRWERPLYYATEGESPKGEHPYPDTDAMPEGPVDLWPPLYDCEQPIGWTLGSLT